MLILLISFVAVISANSSDASSQDCLQRLLGKSTFKLSSEPLCSVSSNWLLDPSYAWSLKVFHVRNTYDSGRKSSWHLNRVLHLLVLLCGDVERNPGPPLSPSHTGCAHERQLLFNPPLHLLFPVNLSFQPWAFLYYT